MSQSLSCKRCRHVWHPRKASTRYLRQCPVCNSSEIDSTSLLVTPTKTVPPELDTAKGVFASRTRLPPVIYDLEAISGASSPENALQRAFELYKKLYLYKVKYDLESVETVFTFLEKETLAAHKKMNESEERLQGILANPENVFNEAGGDLAAVDWYNALMKTGYDKSFLDFLNQSVKGYWESQGYVLRFPEKQDSEM